jgi:hypothetical protein
MARVGGHIKEVKISTRLHVIVFLSIKKNQGAKIKAKKLQENGTSNHIYICK